MLHRFIFGICISLTIPTFGTELAPIVGHGTTCNPPKICNSTQLLTCRNGYCQCAVPYDMTFVQDELMCKVKPGRNCVELIDNSTSQQDPDMTSPSPHPFPPLECTRNSSCDLSTGLCVCQTGLTLDYDAATCRLARIDEKCTSSLECDQSKRLTCSGSGSCICDTDKTVRNEGMFSIRNYAVRGSSNFDVGVDLCVGKVGTSCKVTTSPNSYYAPHQDNKYCVEGARCSHEGECLCENPTWQVTRDKICGKSHNETCSMLIPCSDHLVCTNLGESSEMKCLCPNEAYQIYDASKTSNNRFGSCRGLTHTPCDPTDENSCVENAHCVEQAQGYKFLCQCKPGYLENADQKCAIVKHGEPCDYSKNSARCDHRAGLQCRIVRKVDPTNNLTKSVSACSCPNLNDVYDAELNKCVGQIGVACSDSKICGGDATCLKSGPDSNRTGKCGCYDYKRVVIVANIPKCRRTYSFGDDHRI